MAAKRGKEGCQCSNRSAPAEDGKWQWQWSQQVPIIGKERLTFSGSLSIPANERVSRTPARGAGELSVLGPGADPHHEHRYPP